MFVCFEYVLVRLENILLNVIVLVLVMCMVWDKFMEKVIELCLWFFREVFLGLVCVVKLDVFYVVNFVFIGWVEI